MKIGLVLPALPGYSETFFRSKIRGLAAQEHEVILFIGNGKAVKTDLPCRVKVQAPVRSFPLLNGIRVLSAFVQSWLLQPKITQRYIALERQSGSGWATVLKRLYLNRHILSERQLDWLHFGFATMALEREHVAKALGAKMAVSFRGYDVSRFPLKNQQVYQSVWPKVDKVHSISNALLTQGYKLGLHLDTPYQKITPAIDVAYFSHKINSKNLAQPVQFLTVARLHWVKGLEYTLQALSLLKTQGIDFRYTIIGDGAEYERLVFAAHQLGIRAQVHFAGRIPHEQIKSYYEQADIYLQYSIQEGFCNAVLEAQAMGLWCIVSDAEGLPENVLHEQSGWVVPKRQPQLLAAQIVEVLQMDPVRLDEIRQFAIQRVQEEFNLEKQQREFLEFYGGTG